jgi:hypothetical protein
VFIDETLAKTNMTRTHGWCKRGEPLIDKVPHGHWKTLTFIAALKHDGIAAPCVLDGPINGTSFTVWVEQFLIPNSSLEPSWLPIIWAVTRGIASARLCARLASSSSSCRPTVRI